MRAVVYFFLLATSTAKSMVYQFNESSTHAPKACSLNATETPTKLFWDLTTGQVKQVSDRNQDTKLEILWGCLFITSVILIACLLVKTAIILYEIQTLRHENNIEMGEEIVQVLVIKDSKLRNGTRNAGKAQLMII